VGKRAGVTHKLFFFGTNHFVIFDFPGSSFTRLKGINRRGIHLRAAISTLQGIEHGILARVRPGHADEAVNEMRANNLPVSPAKFSSAGSVGPAKFSAPGHRANFCHEIVA